MRQPMNNRWLHRFAVLTALATLALVGIGGLVTSHEAGMTVPDWPTSYGYNMFFFPVSKWIGGILYEHTHRLVASAVGLMVVGLTRWLGGSPSRRPLLIIGVIEMLVGVSLFPLGPAWKATGHFLSGIGCVVLLAGAVSAHNKPADKPLPLLGWIAFFGVQLQGFLGGLRVTLYRDQIGIFHGALAQLFFVLACAIALFTSRWWQHLPNPETEKPVSKNLRRLFLGATLLIFLQLVLGATMRHQHAGLAIRDFPLAYGKLWPATDAASVAHYNATRPETGVHAITALQIVLQMAHRIVAVLIFGAVACSAWLAIRKVSWHNPLARLTALWLGLIFAQIILGAATIWSDKAADIATAHVMAGALSIATGAMIWIISVRTLKSAHILGAFPGAEITFAKDAFPAEARTARQES
jgi:heme a synthase